MRDSGGPFSSHPGAAGARPGLPRLPGWMLLLALGALAGAAPILAQSPPAAGPKPAAGAKAARPGADTAGPAAAEPTAASPAGQERLMDRIANFIKEHPALIVIGLGVGIAGSLLFLFLSARRQRGRGEEDEVELYPLRGMPEEEGPRRVLIDPETGLAKEMPKRDESEYALVVNEEELQLPHSHESGTAGAADSESAIEELIEEQSFDEAYERYLKRIRDHALSTFRPQVERRMAKHFLKKGDFEKAGHILEHHIATHPASEIEPEVYFDLGYIHFKAKTLPKCKRYFRLFAEKERNPTHSQRARRLLTQLEKVHHLN